MKTKILSSAFNAESYVEALHEVERVTYSMLKKMDTKEWKMVHISYNIISNPKDSSLFLASVLMIWDKT